MVFPVLLLAALGATYLLVVWIRQTLRAPRAWFKIVLVAIALAAVRAVAVGAGALALGGYSSWIQIPAYLFVNLGLPEIVLAGRQSPADPESWYWRAMGIVALGSVTWVFGVAAVAWAANRASKRRPGGETQ